MLVLGDRWVWDWWFVEASGTYHAFYLQAPRSLSDPDLRHRNASIGHASSTDLREWTVLPDALRPGPPGAFDEIATWTGCVVADGDGWTMFYTGLSTPFRQEIGLAFSRDLIAWDKYEPNPVLVSGGPWYAPTDGTQNHLAWRDPWVYRTNGGFEMLVTARDTDSSERAGRGVIGRAVSPDLRNWVLTPPLVTASDFAELEVPQLIDVGGRAVVVFSCGAAGLLGSRRHEPHGGGSYYVALDGDPTSSGAAVPLETPGLYACRVVTDRGGDQQVLGFVNHDDHGEFAGILSDPVPLSTAAPALFAGPASRS